MVKYISTIRRIGSKINDIKYFSHLLPLDVKTIVEPFGGGFAVSKCVYKDINKYKFHINDKDEILFYIYKHYQDYIDSSTKLKHIYINGKITYSSFRKYFDVMDIEPHIKQYIGDNDFIKGDCFKITKSTNYNPDEKAILDNSLITSEDYTKILEQYKDDKDAFIFLDPPYLFSNNTMYDPLRGDNDMTHIIVDIYEYFKTCSCKVMLIINKLSILSYLFKDYVKGEYHKVYQLTKKKAIHLIITNYNI
jgi:site-specific DNA-adenine methylase